MALGLYIALVLSVLVAWAVFHVTKKLGALIFHAIFGLVVFWLFNYFGILKIPLDFVTLLIAALGGVLGVAMVIALSFFGVPL